MGSSATAKIAYGYDLGGNADMGGWLFTYTSEGSPDYLKSEKDPAEDESLDEFDEELYEDAKRPEGLEGYRIRDFDPWDAEEHLKRVLGGLDESAWQDRWDSDERRAAWHKERERIEKAVAVDFVSGGSEYGTNYVLAAWSAAEDWGTRVHVDFAELERRRVEEGWDAKLEAAVRALEIKPVNGPGWFVFAHYG